MTIKMKTNKRVYFILVLVLLVNLIPMYSVSGEEKDAATLQQQTGEYWSVDEEGKLIDGTNTSTFEQTTFTEVDDKELYVKYGKEIEGTSTENLYKINLSVETNDIREVATRPSNVLLVFDVSTSMDYGMEDTAAKAQNVSESRWNIYKNHMKDFIYEFLDPEGENYVEGNQVSIVIFGGSSDTEATAHKTICEWTADANAAIGTFIDYNYVTQLYVPKVDGEYTEISLRQNYFGDTAAYYGVTNGEAGFLGATQVLQDESTTDQYTSVIYVSDGEVNKKYSTDPDVNYVQAAINQAQEMKKYCDKLYAFAIGDDAANSQVMKNETGANTAIDMTFTANDDDEIKDAFAKINEDIIYSTNVWTVTDPMSDWVTFKGFADLSYSGVMFSDDTQTINWDLTKSELTTSSGIDGTIYSYSISYYVELNTDADGFEYDTYLPTNKITTLDYGYSNEKSDRTAEFLIPTLIAENSEQTYQEEETTDLIATLTNTPEYKDDGGINYIETGDDIKYTITVKNDSDTTMTGIWVQDHIPENTSYKEDSAGANRSDIIVSNEETDYINWFIPILAPGEEVELEFSVIVSEEYQEGTVIVNTAQYENTGEITPPDFTGTPEKSTNEVENPTKVAESGIEQEKPGQENEKNPETATVQDKEAEDGTGSTDVNEEDISPIVQDKDTSDNAEGTDSGEDVEEQLAQNKETSANAESADSDGNAGNSLTQDENISNYDSNSNLGSEPKTGDLMSMIPFMIILFAATVVIMFIAIKKLAHK